MESFRKYGIEPLTTAVIHGGPGAPGYMKPVAEEIAGVCGVIEPFQSLDTIDGQVEELRLILKNNCNLPVTLIGHSYGAWLSVIFASENPAYVKKIILVGSGPFEDEFTNSINDTRLSRLSDKDIEELNFIKRELNNPDKKDKKEIFKKFGELSSKADYFKPVGLADDILDFQPEVYQKIMREVLYLRKSGKLLRMAVRINCPVTAIHGDYDPHPYKAIDSLSSVIKDFKFFLLKDCGHYLWNELYAKEGFYEILKKEL